MTFAEIAKHPEFWRIVALSSAGAGACVLFIVGSLGHKIFYSHIRQEMMLKRIEALESQIRDILKPRLGLLDHGRCKDGSE